LGTATSVNISNGDTTAGEAITLTATAAQITGRAVVDAAINNAGTAADDGALTVTGLANDTDLDGVSIEGDLTINMADSATVDVSANAAFGSATWTANATALVMADSSLTATAAQIAGIAISGGDGADAGDVNSSNLTLTGAMAADRNISSDVAATVAVNFTSASIATTKTLTATAAQVTGETIGGAGTVAVSALAADSDLSGVTATTVNVAIAASMDISSNTNLTSVDKFTVADGQNVTISEALLESSVLANAATGTFTIGGTSGDDTIAGDVNDTAILIINGGSGDDIITGGAAADTINGGSNDDTITGGLGADTLNGNAGGDTFVFSSGDTGVTVATADTITGFTTNEDRIDLAITANYVEADGAGNANIAAFITDADASLTANANNVYVEFNVNSAGNAYVAIDGNNDGSFNDTDDADIFIILTGVNTADEIAVTDFI
jgi:Ca2+-binding RTX toxin-like protein